MAEEETKQSNEDTAAPKAPADSSSDETARPRSADRSYSDRSYSDRSYSDRPGGRFQGRSGPGGGPGGPGGFGGPRGPRGAAGPGGRPRRRFTRRKMCPLCTDKIKYLDYKDVSRLKQYITERGKIRPSRMTGMCAGHQRELTVAIKRARTLALLPFKN